MLHSLDSAKPKLILFLIIKVYTVVCGAYRNPGGPRIGHRKSIAMSHHPVAAGKSSFDFIDKALFFREMPVTKEMTVLDAACGIGNYAVALAEHAGGVGQIYAVDLWEEGIRELDRRIRERNIDNIHTAVADLSRHIPVASHTIDLCLMATVLHDLIQDGTEKGALSELCRVVKPGGIFAVVEFRKIEGPPGPPMAIRLSPEELTAAVTPYGFVLQKSVEVGSIHYMSLFTAPFE